MYLVTLACCFIAVVGSKHGHNKQCLHPLANYQFSSMTKTDNQVLLEFSKPHLVQKLLINTTGCDVDRELIESNFTVKYIDSSDASFQWVTYSENLTGAWQDSDKIKIVLSEVVYTEQILLISSGGIQCSEVFAQGCSTRQICQPDTCKNGSTCIGNDHCACAEGFMGDDCSQTVAEMTMDDYDIVAAAAGLLFTKDAPFSVDGDVDFTINEPPFGKRRSSHGGHHGHNGLHHGNSAHFHGLGGSVSFSSSHLAGYTSSHHSNHGYHSSNNPFSALHGGHAFSQRCHFSIGLGHNHLNTHYLFTSHGNNHYHQGASLHYHNNFLHLHVHLGLSNHHFHVSAGFNPQPGAVNHIACSFSPITGASILINGLLSSHQPHPVVHPHVTLPNVNLGLCFGICSPTNHLGGFNLTTSNLAIAGASIPTLVQNNILGLLGNTMTNLLVSQLFPHYVMSLSHSTPQTSQRMTTKQASTSTTPVKTTTKSMTTTTKSMTTTTKSVTASTTSVTASTTSVTATTLPMATTTIPITATTNPAKVSTSKLVLPMLTRAPKNTTTSNQQTSTSASSQFGPICHDCFRQQTDGSCATAMQCSTGEVCLAMHDRNGYTHRCVTQQDCTQGTLKASSDCWYCCSGNLCNDRCIKGSSSTCQDDPQCANIRNLGSFYNVCADPALSITTCKRTCNHCP